MRRHERAPVRRPVIARLISVASVCAVLVSGCGGPNDEAFWGGLRNAGSEAEHFDTLRDMRSQADVVVRGSFSSVAMGRTIVGDATTPQAAYELLTAQLAVTEVLAGSAPTASLPVEFVLFEQGEPIADTAARLIESYPQGELVIFLRDKGGIEAGRYRMVNSLGLWTETSRAELDTPLADLGPAVELPYQSELAGVDSVGELAALIREWS